MFCLLPPRLPAFLHAAAPRAILMLAQPICSRRGVAECAARYAADFDARFSPRCSSFLLPLFHADYYFVRLPSFSALRSAAPAVRQRRQRYFAVFGILLSHFDFSPRAVFVAAIACADVEAEFRCCASCLIDVAFRGAARFPLCAPLIDALFRMAVAQRRYFVDADAVSRYRLQVRFLTIFVLSRRKAE